LGQKGKLFIMLQTISIQILVNFGQRKSYQIEYKVCADFGILEKELWQGPLASSPRRPKATCPGPRARGSAAVAWSLPTTSRRCGWPPATPPPCAAHAATAPCALIPRCHGHRRSTPYHDSSRQLAVSFPLLASPFTSAMLQHCVLPRQPLSVGLRLGNLEHRPNLGLLSEPSATAWS
jgi:hypothetical protein